ncbi:MAG: hypothetical protein F6K22_02490 [Okeania sp. SIO2F4]|uniref:hypothetical protein n=1 Tax=Okeania sp. SIO2F4 TaxID=2607790 RepID=UPI00142A85EE|nr:hypothetical protein [Okeania sp. SIO2F4]NES01792.1 hypothetical protein [Okeania sp. SIO2F4]
MNSNNDKYFCIYIKCRNIGVNKKIFSYLKEQDTPFNKLVLDSLKLLWLPYVLASIGSPEKAIGKEIEVSYEKVRQHFNLMCLELNHNMRREEPILVTNQTQVVSNNATSIEEEEDNSEFEVRIFDKTDNIEF